MTGRFAPPSRGMTSSGVSTAPWQVSLHDHQIEAAHMLGMNGFRIAAFDVDSISIHGFKAPFTVHMAEIKQKRERVTPNQIDGLKAIAHALIADPTVQFYGLWLVRLNSFQSFADGVTVEDLLHPDAEARRMTGLAYATWTGTYWETDREVREWPAK